jgi:hypothetical protein
MDNRGPHALVFTRIDRCPHGVVTQCGGEVSRDRQEEAGIAPRRWGGVDAAIDRLDIAGPPDNGGARARRNHTP